MGRIVPLSLWICFPLQLDKGERLPVMLYIHGGAFNRGSSGVEMYGPDYLIQADVVFVSFNYRIGALGMKIYIAAAFVLPTVSNQTFNSQVCLKKATSVCL